MTKIIKIENCRDCPYQHYSNGIKGIHKGYWCEKEHGEEIMLEIIPNYPEIPIWCTLDNEEGMKDWNNALKIIDEYKNGI